MKIIADVAAYASRAAPLLIFSATVLAPPAVAQPAPTTPAIRSAGAAATGAASNFAPAAPSGTVTATAVAPAPPVSLPASVLAPAGKALQAPEVGETALTLDVGSAIRAVPPSRITVPVGETLLITAPGFANRSVQWLKDGRPLPGATGLLLALHGVRSSDAGIYQLVTSEPTRPALASQFLVLGVGPTSRLVNQSTRAVLAAGAGQNLTAGFVIAAGAAQSKKLVLRAVGPALAVFGVANPLRAPVLRVFDAAGNPYTNGYAYPAIVGGPTYETDLADAVAKTGAFPIPPGTLDAVVMMPFLPGAYTAQVTSGDHTAGSVLLEIYEVP